jgi:hypothetical protein
MGIIGLPSARLCSLFSGHSEVGVMFDVDLSENALC